MNSKITTNISVNPKQENLVLSGYGLSFKVDSGKLIIDDGFINEGTQRRTILPRGINNVKRIVILGHSGNLSFDAIRWLMDANITTTFMSNDGEITTSFEPQNRSCVALKKAQALSRHAGIDITIAEYLVAKKLEGQAAALHHLSKLCSHLINDERKRVISETISFINNLKSDLHRINDVEDALLFEANAAAKYWRMWEGLPLKWQNSAAKKAPDHWKYIRNRTSGKFGDARNATDPVNAIFNFCYSILEARAKTACVRAGLETDFGIIHADRDNRAAFVYDIMEPVRPVIDEFILEFVLSHTFKSKELHESREGICRLDPDLITLLINKYPDVDMLLDNTLKEVKRILDRQAKEIKKLNTISMHSKRVLKHEKKELFCLKCGSLIETQGKKFCSRKCYAEWKKGNNYKL